MKRALLVGAALWAMAGRGRADSLKTLGVGVIEREHEVTVRVAGNVSFLEVTRHFENGARLDDEVTLAIDLPAGAAVTGLRVGRPGAWHSAVLLDEAAAKQRYLDLTGDDASAPAGTPALMSLRGETVTLELFRVPAQGDVQVAYSVIAPLARVDGRRQLVFPVEAQPRLLAPRFANVPRAETFEVTIVGESRVLRFPGSPRTLTARGARLDVAGGQLWRVEVDAPLRLSTAPSPHSVVFVIDRSRSEGAAGVRAQLALVQAYLTAAPTTRFALVGFDRQAQQLTPGLLAAARFPTVAPPSAEDNGSDLLAGLALAVRSLAGVTGERRIIAFTDGYLRRDTLEAAAKLVIPAGILIHVVLRERGDSSDDRNSFERTRLLEHDLATLAHAQGGMAIRLAGGAPHDLARAAIELLRPVRLDGVSLLMGRDAEGEETTEELGTVEEGSGLRVSGLAPSSAGAPALRLRGWRWGERIDQFVPMTPALAAVLPALAVGDDSYAESAHPELIANLAGALSGSTSLLVVATEARDVPWVPVHGRLHVNNFRCGLTVGTAHAGPASPRPQVRELVRSCRGSGGQVTLGITGDEIIDVATRGFGAATTCIEDGLWSMRLAPAEPGNPRYYDFDLSPPPTS
ncbi:MAG: hypothetical protein IT370_23375 [Deltaproteobacteria bacterium]|nr:hypothetical protein [Deltaproteobacteria bacterium]